MDSRKDKTLINFKKKVLAKYSDARILLFGSRARRENLNSSDYDLIVISDKFKGKKIPQRFDIYDCFDSKYNVDIIPYTNEEFEKNKKRISIAKKAFEEGIFI